MKLPDIPPNAGRMIEQMSTYMDALQQVEMRPADDGRYLHWDAMRRKAAPDGLSHEQWWALVRGSRLLAAKQVPLLSTAGVAFGYTMTDHILEMTHWFDQNLSGSIGAPDLITAPATRNRYVISALTEEAITSSQLEGASTTRKVAKEMLRSGRPPRTKAERMILNNYRAMQQAVSARDDDLTPEFICTLHRTLTDGTLENPDAAGRFQLPGEERVGVYWDNELLLHTPPAASELPQRVEAMCRFANGEDDDRSFLHPVVRAVLLHLWLAYDHPFEDGNGRTARMLFYWCLLRQGYWLAEFVSISRILLKAPAQYAMSFLYTESDDSDATYVIHYQLDVLRRAVEELHAYLDKSVAEMNQVERALKADSDLNHRQLALLGHALRHPGQAYTFDSHKTSHRVAYQTARTDLIDLAERGLLLQSKRGSTRVFRSSPNLAARLGDGADG